MNIFPQPKKMICNGQFTNHIRTFYLVRDDFEAPELEFAMSKLSYSDEGIKLSVVADKSYKNEEYTLELDNDKATVIASTPRGVFNAIITLCQIIKKDDLCCVRIDDYPDFEDRGLMIDFSRGRTPTLEVMKKIVDMIAMLKYNQLQMAFDAIVFEYKGLEKYYEGKPVVTREYVAELQDYCKKNMIDLVPNQNGFGHMQAWLAFEDFEDLAECPYGFYRTDECGYTSLWKKGTLNPYDPRSFELVDRIYGGLLPYFDSNRMNCCCDETFDLSNGEGKSHAIVKEIGLTKVYTEYMNKLHKICGKYGKRMMFWADMIMHDVSAMKDMPKDAVAIVWGYEQEFPYDVYCKNAKESGLDFYVAPGTCTWSSILGRSDNMKFTQHSAAENGKKFGAKGYLLTDWSGSMHAPVVGDVPTAYGGGVAWGVDENYDIEKACCYLDENYYFDKGFAKFLYDCGNAYTFEAYKRFNAPLYYNTLSTRVDFKYYMYDQTPQHFLSMIRFLTEQIAKSAAFDKCPKEYVEGIKLNLEMVRSLAKVCVIKAGGEFDYKEIVAEFEEQSEKLENMWLKKDNLNTANEYKECVDELIKFLKLQNANQL